MRSWIPVSLIACALLIFSSPAAARNNDSLQIFIQQLQQRYEARSIPDSQYIKAIDSIIFYCFDRTDFPQFLENYRIITSNNAALREHKIIYFQYRGIHAVNNGSTGQSIFFFEKMGEEARAQKNRPRELAADRAIITILADNENFTKCLERYQKLLPQLKAEIDSVTAGRSSGIMMENVSGILITMIRNFYEKGKKEDAYQTEALLNKIKTAVQKDPPKYEPFLAKINVTFAEGAKFKAIYDANDPREAGAKLSEAIWEINHKGMNESMKPFFLYDQYTTGSNYFMKAGITDSAFKYLTLLRDLELPMIKDRKYQFYHEQMATLQARQGNWQQAYEHDHLALRLKDSILTNLQQDRDNNLYAQSESEFNQLLLNQTQLEKAKAEKRLTWLLFAFGILLLLGVGSWFWLRQRQLNRFLQDKLRMARNIHDEIGPLLLYIKLLARKEKEIGTVDSPYMPEVETSINHVIETVRGLSHDLKSTKEATTDQLYEEIKTLLDKTQALTGITYQFYYNKKEKPLNYFQYQHLRNIFSELVNNTIKHAEWNSIDSMLKVEPKKIMIVYTDNGLGFEPSFEEKKGIGLANIRERVEKLRGELELRNHYPEGYTIEINIPFS
ncbi:hypothetical protein HHL16_22960 [Pseudoflavitalea sp. G-6-1-2]|uniref:sensor histidine kinase n=1 Tax=Pseudoflavitalea sp. G-6-1-2 TaxID=2728841 RepID=UPI00146A16FA|nr:ATP-binding protein [Pseudoflavitalea sp. G-6-1-2]NML23760.1 hypothetical protein [Pseudoflavitalea sp. G-6-1-2]